MKGQKTRQRQIEACILVIRDPKMKAPFPRSFLYGIDCLLRAEKIKSMGEHGTQFGSRGPSRTNRRDVGYFMNSSVD